jgi:hypothetical protein
MTNDRVADPSGIRGCASGGCAANARTAGAETEVSYSEVVQGQLRDPFQRLGDSPDSGLQTSRGGNTQAD